MNTFLSVKAPLAWQGIVVLVLLVLPIILSRLVRIIPRDLQFTIAALLSGLAGIVTSSQIYQAGVNQAVLAIIGLWVLGKAMQQQGAFHAFISFLTPVKKGKILSYISFFCQTVFFGAFLHHRYFPVTTLRTLVRNGEKQREDLSVYGFPFSYLLLIGGLATAIGTSVNILFLSLYSYSIKIAFTGFFAFLPLAILPILFSFSLLLLFRAHFRKPFSQFIDAASCAVVPPDSLLIGKPQAAAIVREGKSIPKSTLLQSGDLLLFTKSVSRTPFSLAMFVNTDPYAIRWKKIVSVLFFLGAILSIMIAGVQIGAAFFVSGLLLLTIRPFPLKKSFQEEFPFPLLLEIFSAYLFFFAMQSSGLSAWCASFISLPSSFLLLTVFFIAAQIAAHLMPRPIAFALLFSIALKIFTAHQLLLLGTNIAFAVAVPLFGKPLLDEIAISNAISGKSPLLVRALLILILFGSTAISTCLFWPN